MHEMEITRAIASNFTTTKHLRLIKLNHNINLNKVYSYFGKSKLSPFDNYAKLFDPFPLISAYCAYSLTRN